MILNTFLYAVIHIKKLLLLIHLMGLCPINDNEKCCAVLIHLNTVDIIIILALKLREG